MSQTSQVRVSETTVNSTPQSVTIDSTETTITFTSSNPNTPHHHHHPHHHTKEHDLPRMPSNRSDVEFSDVDTDVEADAAEGSEESEHDRQLLDKIIQEALNSYEDNPKPCHADNIAETPAPWGAWSEDDTTNLKVRGPTFFDDKIKIPVGIPIFKLVHVDMFYTSQDNENLVHVAARPGNWAFKYLERREKRWKELHDQAAAATNDHSPKSSSATTKQPHHQHHSHSHHACSDPNSPLFIVNFLFPGPSNKNMNLVLYFLRRIRPGEELKRRAKEGPVSNGSAFTSRAGSLNGPAMAALLQQLHLNGSESQLIGASQLKVKGPLSTYNSAVTSPTSATSSSPSPSPSPASPPSATVDIPRVCAFDGLLRRFLDGSGTLVGPAAEAALDEYRDCRFKIIPRIAAGPWIVRKGVGCVPAILGKKVKQRYYRDPVKNYMEIVADVSSSMIAGRILALVKGAATSLTIDLSFILQGETIDELPESLMGGVRIYRCNLDKLLEVEEHERWLTDVWLKKEVEEGRW